MRFPTHCPPATLLRTAPGVSPVVLQRPTYPTYPVKNCSANLRNRLSAARHWLRPSAASATMSDLDGRLVLAASGSGTSRGIGIRGDLPWPRLAGDMRRFVQITRGAAVVMGRATYKSLPEAARPLPGRVNVVLSSQSREALGLRDDVLLAGSLDAAEQLLRARRVAMPFYVIGGADIFREALKRPAWSTRIYYTDIQGTGMAAPSGNGESTDDVVKFEFDRMFDYDIDAGDSDFQLVSVGDTIREAGVTYQFKEYVRLVRNKTSTVPSSFAKTTSVSVLESGTPAATKGSESDGTVEARRASSQPHPEQQYLSLIRRILTNGISRGDRTGTGTRSLFGETMRFDLRESFPLLTTKRVFWRGVAEELLWFIRGSTNANLLAEKGIHIWDGNGSREFLDKRGYLEREVGDLGPVYGFQWRHFGAEYRDMHADYSGKGVDQLSDIIQTIKTRPYDRRMILSAWNPAAVCQMALPPCHMMAQFYVAKDELSCMMYQRSCDMGLGVPFNIASYALLTRLIAYVTGLKAGDFIHVLGDAHVYDNHTEALNEQLQREPRPFPKLHIHSRPDLRTIDDFRVEDFEIVDYHPHRTIKMQMAV